MTGVGITSWATAIPMWRLDRGLMGSAWDTPALPGERAVAGGDQDSLTLAVEAALAAAPDPSAIDAVFFATTTPPYAEKHGAATIAAVLDRHSVRTADFTGTIRAGTQATLAGMDAVRSGSARAALVVAADLRPAEPSSVTEQLFGDGAGAIVIGPDAPVEVVSQSSFAEESPGPWRRTGDPFVRSFDAKSETEYGYARAIEEAVTTALGSAGVAAADVAAFAAFAPDPRTYAVTAKRLGMSPMKDPLFASVGNLGAAHALVSLAHALDGAAPGDAIVFASAGEGADAIVLRAREGVTDARPARTTDEAIADKRALPSYERYLRFRELLPWEDPVVPGSPIRAWRDREQAFPLYGVRCTACGVVQFPANRACIACSVADKMERVRLQKRGTVFTFTLDHLVGGRYLETPVPRLVVELDGGGRIFLEGTDCDPGEVAVGMLVELTFRLMHEGANIRNYYWKARPARPGGAA
ncbi:MAG TPA: OB-fold domain-containing protein [Actinomycetota bacterium]